MNQEAYAGSSSLTRTEVYQGSARIEFRYLVEGGEEQKER